MSTEVEHKEDTFESFDQLRLFNQSWKPRDPKAVLIIVHGLKDHSGRYANVAEELTSHGFAVHALDLRGHGKSEGDRAFVNSFDDYLRDVQLFYDQVQRLEPGKPIFLFGHSMGGAIALLHSLAQPSAFGGLILSAPALKVPSDVPSLLIWFTKGIGGIAPKRPVLKLENSLFTRDTDFLAAMNSDPLIYNKPHPARTAAELLRAIDRIQKTMSSLALPVMIMHGTADKITNPDGSRQLNESASSKDKTLRLYEGHYHDLLHDLGNSHVSEDLLQWLDAHSFVSRGSGGS